AQPRVLRADRGVVEACGNRMGELHVAVLVLQNETARALKHAGAATRAPRVVLTGADPVAAGFDADQPRGRVAQERVEDSHGVAASADARDDRVGKRAELLQGPLDTFP